MTTNYAYTPYIWPSVFTIILLISLGIYAWRQRSVPGALPFVIGCLFAALWAACSLMEYAAVDLATKIFWTKFQAACSLPIIIAVTCFILEYAWPGRWLTRRVQVLLIAPCLLVLGLVLTDDLHHLVYRGFAFDGSLQIFFNPGGWILIAYAIGFLGIINCIVFAWLFLHSPLHRWPVVLMLTGLVVGRLLYLLDRTDILHSALPLGLFGMAFEFLMYAIALFGFRIFDPIVLARQAAVAKMHDGVLVLDPQGKIVSLNPAAVAILGIPAKSAHGRLMREILLSYSDPQGDGMGESEISLGRGMETRYYQLQTSVLKDWRGLEIGRLLLLHDVTSQKRAQAQIMEQQRALAALHEREMVARELHDGLGQVLAYVRIQAQAARDWLAQDQKAAADSSLAQLVEVAQDAHTDVREYILGARLATSVQSGFLPALQRYLQDFSRLYSLPTELIASPDWVDDLLEPTAEAQLLRIIQEALTNARKHSRAHKVQVCIQTDTDCTRVTVQDDGVGFDPAMLGDGEGQKYGFGFMRERAEDIGGSLAIHSAPGQGTRIMVEVPLKRTAVTRKRGDERHGDAETRRHGEK